MSYCLSFSCAYSACGVKDTQKGVFRVKLVAEVSHAPEEEVVPLIVQLISPPFLGRTVLTAGPAKFGMDLSKQEHGVRGTRVQQECLNVLLVHLNLKNVPSLSPCFYLFRSRVV